MASIATVKKRAAELTSKGQFEEAVREYEKLLKVNENDPGIHNLLGDLYLKMGKRELAFEEFEHSVELYTREEFYSNAVAVAKKVLRLDADQAIIYKQLGDLYEKQGLMGDAISNLMEYAERKKMGGAMEEVCEAYKKAIEWMPKRVDLRMSLVDLFITMMKNDEAIKVLREVADLFREQEKFENAEGIEQRIRDLGGIVDELPSVEPTFVEPSLKEPQKPPPSFVEEFRFEQMETVIGEEATLDVTPPREDKIVAEEIPEREEALSIEKTKEPAISFDEIVSKKGEEMEPSHESLFKTSPTDLESYVELAEMCLTIGSEDEAIEHYYTAGDAYLDQKSLERAKEIYEKIGGLRPKDLRYREKILQVANLGGDLNEKIQASLDLGECLLQMGEKEKAQTIYRDVLQMDPQNPIALDRSGTPKPERSEEIQGVPLQEIPIEEFLTTQIEPDTLLEEFREGLDKTLERGDTSSYYDLGITYKEMGLLDEAIESLQKASQGKEERLKALEMLGICYMEKGEMESAAFQFIQGLRLEGYSPQEVIGLQYNLGIAYEKMGQKKKALDAFESAAKLNPNFRDLSQKISSLKEEVSGIIRRDKKRRERISYV